ncbi:NCS1 nucleoside transporter [Tricholoma matsutake]|nr:NCS1 nucleoside transporter [Tricholoma matsutake 945]
MVDFYTFYQEKIVLRPDKGSFTAQGQSTRLSNKDLDPVPSEKKKWEWYHVTGFWVAEGFSVVRLEVPSSAVAVGLNPGYAIVACLIGNLMVTVPCCIVGWIGSKYSINFPVIARSSFGIRGAYFAMTVRAVVCVIYYGIQSSLGGNAVQCMIEAIWPSFKTWHLNALPASSAITAPQLLSFTIFWLASLPFLYLSVPALRWMFMVKVAIMPFFAVSLFTWALAAGHGWGPLFSIPSKITNGRTVGFVFCSTINAAISGTATFAVNMADVTRYARSPRDACVSQAISIPLTMTLTQFLGAVMAASAQVIYGQVIWNPLNVVTLWNNRAAQFFAGLFFAFANIGTNVTGNSIPFANDLTGMFPKYINIRRGQFICALLGFAICPWEIQAKATRFLAFLGGYTIFLGALLGVLLSDFFLVRRCKGFHIYSLYKFSGLYWFTAGWNFRAIAAFATGIAPLLPGLVFNINTSTRGIGRGILNLYTFSWLVAAVFSGVMYYLIFLVFPFQTETDEEDKAGDIIEALDYKDGPATTSGTGDRKITVVPIGEDEKSQISDSSMV